MVPRSEYVTSTQLLFNFTISQLKGYSFLIILSVFNDKLLVGGNGLKQLLICNRGGRPISNITTIDNDRLVDAAWTPHGNIVYTTYEANKLVVMSKSGAIIIRHPQLGDPNFISVTSNTIYIANYMKRTVYESKNDGISWQVVFEVNNPCWQAMKVTIERQIEDYWVMENRWEPSFVNNNYVTNNYIHVYNVKKSSSDGVISDKDIFITATDGTVIAVYENCLLAYDGYMNIFFSDKNNKSIHVLSVNGQFHSELLSSDLLKNEIIRPAIDRKNQLMYVGLKEEMVGVFKLMYD